MHALILLLIFKETGCSRNKFFPWVFVHLTAFGIVVYRYIDMKIYLPPDILVAYKQKGWVVTEVYLDVHGHTALVRISWQLGTEEELCSQGTSNFHLALHTFYTRRIAQSKWWLTAWCKHNIALNHFWGVLKIKPQSLWVFQNYCALKGANIFE